MALTVADVTDRLGPTVVLAESGGLDAPVTDICVVDPAFPAEPAANALLVAVGFEAASEAFSHLIDAVRDAGAAGVVVKAEGLGGASHTGPAVVAVDPGADWGQLLALLRAAVVSQDADAHPEDSLFGLADAIAALCGGSVVIHDPAWQMLAYSGGQRMDAMRSETILGRRAPASALAGLRAAGVLDAIHRGEVVEIDDGEVPGLAHRFAVAACAGPETLATIWLQPEEDAPSDSIKERLRRAAEVAALTLLRHAATGPGGAGTGDAAFNALLAGNRTERIVAERLGADTESGFVLCGLRPTVTDERDRAATARRLQARARSHCDAFRVKAQVAAGLDTTYLVFAAADDQQRARAVRIVTEMHTRLQSAAPHRAMVSPSFRSLTEIASARHNVDELLALSERRGWSGLTDSEDVHASWRLDQFREVALAHPALLSGPVARLANYDRSQGTELVTTLRAYFDAVGDMKAASQVLALHVNTVRYRIGKAQEIGRFSLDLPDDRLLVELQVRLLS